MLCDGGETHFIAWAKSGDISLKKQTYIDELWALFSPVSVTTVEELIQEEIINQSMHVRWLEKNSRKINVMSHQPESKQASKALKIARIYLASRLKMKWVHNVVNLCVD